MSHDMFPYDDPLDELEQAIVDEAMKNGGRIKFRTLEEILTPNKEIMKAKCIKQYKQLEDILDKGDIVEIEVIRSTEDKVIVNKINTERKNPFILTITEETIAPAGSYEEWKFKSKDGHYYTGTGITNRIGNKTLFDLFKKL